ncbi:MAG: MFS transporter, partial [Pseudomonadota bacterium]|nr:MFS transporter [Pseudomonadota bacterium]
VWSIPVLVIAVIVWVVRPRSAASHAPKAAAAPRLWWPDWRDPLTWRLGLIAGYASSLYFANSAFLPDYLATRGRADLLNPTLAALNWVQMFASVLMLLYGQRLALKRWPFMALGAVSALALVGLLTMADEWIVAWAGVIGFCNALMLILTLALPPMLAAAHDVHRLSAAMIAIGYLCAFVIPIAGGFLWDVTGVAAWAFVPLLAFALVAVVLAAGLKFSGARTA